jgi:hypothetical protein
MEPYLSSVAIRIFEHGKDRNCKQQVLLHTGENTIIDYTRDVHQLSLVIPLPHLDKSVKQYRLWTQSHNLTYKELQMKEPALLLNVPRSGWRPPVSASSSPLQSVSLRQVWINICSTLNESYPLEEGANIAFRDIHRGEIFVHDDKTTCEGDTLARIDGDFDVSSAREIGSSI